MAELITITGTTGSGKSRSTKNLDPETTFIATTIGRSLPYKGWKSMYNTEKKNYAKANTYQKLFQVLKHVNDNKKFKVLIIDDIDYLMKMELFKRATEGGYSKFTEIAKHMQELLEFIDTKLRDDLIVFVMFHEELVLIDGYKPSRTVQLPGKMIKEKFHPFELTNISLFTEVEYNKEGEPTYYFRTTRSETCEGAKSPEGMFESGLIPNDLSIVVEKVREYETA